MMFCLPRYRDIAKVNRKEVNKRYIEGYNKVGFTIEIAEIQKNIDGRRRKRTYMWLVVF